MGDEGNRARGSHLLEGCIGEAIMREWESIDIGEPDVAWAAAAERFLRESRRNQDQADRLSRDAADALKQAAIHQARADDFRQLANAISQAPVTFTAQEDAHD